MRNGSTPTSAAASAGETRSSGIVSPSRRGRSHRLIGDVVVDLGLADRDTVEAAVSTARVQGKTTGQVLLEQGILRHDQVARVVAERFGLDYIDLSVYEVDSQAVNLIGVEAAKRYEAVPVGFLADRTLLVAMADPTNVLAIDDIAMITGLEVRAAAASEEDVRELIGRLARLEESLEEVMETEAEADRNTESEVALSEDEESPVIKLVHSIINQAVDQSASDIHFNPEEGDMRVLFRVDGVLHPVTTVPRKMRAGIVSRIKLMADMDIAEKRAPQDGRLTRTVDGRRVDIRVVTLPLVGGESAVLRLLDKGVVVRDLDTLGMLPGEKERFTTAIAKPHGTILVTGPTGSGKTTTLYAALTAINSGERSILTIEDPVESPLAGIKQMQIAPKAGVTFATGLRTMLRADPDVIMVGEIRDRETAQIGVEAALTGHLVLSTLHTKDAPSALTRLVDMGIEPFMVASAIDCVAAQRLARTLCKDCKRAKELSPAAAEENGLGSCTQIYEAVGCSRCGNTGYKGRVGLYEIMPVTDELRSMILERRALADIAELAISQGMKTLREDGIEKVRAGITTLAEVGRVSSTL
jgi:type IV pilus assembly protein PilB